MTLVPTAESDELVRQSNLSHPRSPTHISANSPHGTNPARSLDDGESKDPSVMSSKRRLPLWVKEQLPGWGERFCLPEWDDDDDFFEGDELLNDKSEMNNEYRGNNGWKGRDLCHSSTAPVRISHYAVQYSGNDGVGTTITGVAHFTPHAESHAGFCHGGSMTSVMDDIIGWTAFHASGQCIPWSGFTAQINVTLKRPISVGSYLKIMGTITKREGRKVWVHAQLLVADACESEDGKDVVVHCTAEGLAILKRECA